MSRSIWSKISQLRQAREPLAWWKREFGADYGVCSPFLIPCTGLAGQTYPCPDTGIPLQIHESGGSYLAYPTGDESEDTPDRNLTWDDVQAWRFDHNGLRRSIAKAFGITAGQDSAHEDIQFIGFCDKPTVRKRVYLALPDGIDAAVRIAADTGQTPEAGCLLFPERHAGAEHILKARGVSFLALDECSTFESCGIVGSCGATCRTINTDISNIELKTQLDGRFDTLGRNFADLKNENQALKQDLAQVLSNIAKQIEPKFFQWIFVILGAGSVNAAAKILKIPGSTFSGQLKEYVARGGLYSALYSMLGVRKKGAGQKRIERFNELFREHQGEKTLAEPDVLRELLDGLEELNGSNWKVMREELIAIVKTKLPEE